MCRLRFHFVLAPLLFGREAAHSTRENDQIALFDATGPSYLDARGPPGQRTGFALGERGEDGERISAAPTGKAAKVLVPLSNRHGYNIGRDPRGENRRRADASARRTDFDKISLLDAKLSGR